MAMTRGGGRGQEEAGLGALLDELDALLAMDHGERVVMRPAASADDLRRLWKALPREGVARELATWFAWHDGQSADASGRFEPGSLQRPMSIEEVLAAPRWPSTPEAAVVLVAISESERWLYDADAEEIVEERADGSLVPRGPLVQWVRRVVRVRRTESAAHQLSHQGPDGDLSVAQRIVLATAGQLTTQNGGNLRLLGGRRRVVGTATAHHLLRYWWDVFSQDAALETLQALLVEGEAADELPAVAWAYGRAAMVAGTAYVAGLLSHRTAWQAMVEAAKGLRGHFEDWVSFGDAYAVAAGEWEAQLGGDASAAHEKVERVHGAFARAYAELVTTGAWSELPFMWEGGDPPPPPDPPPPKVWSVTPDGRDGTSTLETALAAAGAGDRLELEPGLYEGGHELEHFVHLVGVSEGVVIEGPPHEPCLAVRRGTLILDSVEIRSRPSDDEECTAAALKLWGGHVHATGCRIEGNRIGYWQSRGHAVLVECEIRGDGLIAAQVDAGSFCADRSTFSHAQHTNLQVSGDDLLVRLERCSLLHAGQFGLGIWGSPKVEARRCTFYGAGRHAVVTAGQLALEGCLLAGTGAATCQVDGGTLHARQTEFRDAGGSGLYAHEGSHVALLGCLMHHTPGSGVMLDGSAEALIEGCDLYNCNTAALVARGAEVRVQIQRSRLAEAAMGPGVMAVGSRVSLLDTHIDRNCRHGVEASEGARVTMVGGGMDHNLEAGVHASGGADLRLVRVRIQGSRVGVLVDGAELRAAETQARSCDEDGVRVESGLVVGTECEWHGRRHGMVLASGAAVLASGRIVGGDVGVLIEGGRLATVDAYILGEVASRVSGGHFANLGGSLVGYADAVLHVEDGHLARWGPRASAVTHDAATLRWHDDEGRSVTSEPLRADAGTDVAREDVAVALGWVAGGEAALHEDMVQLADDAPHVRRATELHRWLLDEGAEAILSDVSALSRWEREVEDEVS